MAMGMMSVITTVGVVAYIATLWALKAIIENSVRSEFDTKLERVRADIRAREAEIEGLRAGALAALRDRHANLDKRRLLAAERLWEHVSDSGKLKFLSTMAQSLRMEAMFDIVEKGGRDADGIVQMAEMMSKVGGVDDVLKRQPITREQPFISPIVWALFSAYNLALMHPVALILALKSRLGRKVVADPASLIATLKAALPHQAGFLDQYGADGVPFLVDELEKALLKALVASLSGEETDVRSVQQAAAIMKHAESVTTIPQQAVDIPDKLKADPLGPV